MNKNLERLKAEVEGLLREEAEEMVANLRQKFDLECSSPRPLGWMNKYFVGDGIHGYPKGRAEQNLGRANRQ